MEAVFFYINLERRSFVCYYNYIILNKKSMTTNEKERGKQEILSVDRLFKAREKALDTAKGDKLVNNFAEAMGLVAKLDQTAKLGEWAIGSSKKYTSLGDSIIDLMQEVKGLVDQGENDQAQKLFEGKYQQIVEQTLLEGGAGMDYDLRTAHRYFGEQEVELAINNLIPNGREFIELGKKEENSLDDMRGMIIDLWIWAGKNKELRTEVERAIKRIIAVDKGEMEKEIEDGNPSTEYERLKHSFVDAGTMRE